MSQGISNEQPSCDKKKISGWCLTSGTVGYETQCLGIFDSLGIQAEIKRVHPQGWHQKLAPISPAAYNPAIAAPWPDMLIVSGRQAIPYARKIKRESKGKTFVAVLQSPGLPASWFDFIWVPLHDKPRGKNIFPTLTSPNRLTTERLQYGRDFYLEAVQHLPRPVVTVLVGGPSRSHQFGINEVEKLCSDLIALHEKTGCSFLVSPSYRTGSDLLPIIQKNMSKIPSRVWDMKTENPYLGYMASADFFIVTSDSVNMLGEAAATGRPVYAYPVVTKHTKFDKFHALMQEHGAIKWFDGSLASWSYTPLNSSPIIAQALWARFIEHRAQWKM